MRVVPPKHRGAAEIVPIRRSPFTGLFFLHQRQKLEISRPRRRMLPAALPDRPAATEYAQSNGLASSGGGGQRRVQPQLVRDPDAQLVDLQEQLASPIAVFQLLCSVLWMLDEYWKYTPSRSS